MRKLILITVFAILPSLAKALPEDRFNIMFSPILPLIGALSGELSYKLTPNWTIGPEFATLNWKIFDLKVKASSLAFAGRYSFNEVYTDGWVLKGALGGASAEVSAKDSSGVEHSASGNSSFVHLGGGYQWFWDSFNIDLLVMMSSSSTKSIEIVDSSGAKVEEYKQSSGGLEFMLGFTF